VRPSGPADTADCCIPASGMPMHARTSASACPEEPHVSSRIPRFVSGLVLAAAAGTALGACNPLVPPAPVQGGSHPVSHPSPTSGPTTGPTSPAPTTNAAAYEARVLVLVNAERAKLGEH